MSKAEWLPWGCCLLALMMAVGVGYAAWERMEKRGRALQVLRGRVDEAEAAWRERRMALEIVAESGDWFRRNQERAGWAARRLDWMPMAAAAAGAAALPELEYTVGAREILWRGEDLALWRVPVELDLGLVHEERLLTFWKALERDGEGYFSLEECRIEPRPGEPAPRRANLRAHCRMDWYGFANGTEDDEPDVADDREFDG